MSVMGTPMPNLLPERWVRARRSRRELRRWASLGVAAWLAIAVPSVLAGLHLRSAPLLGHARVEQLDREIAAIRAQIPALEKRLGALSGQVAVRERAAQRLRWGSLLVPVIAMLPPDSRITTLAGAIEDSGGRPIAVRVSFITASQSPARQSVVRLERSGLFDRVELLETQRTSTDEGVGVIATIRMVIEADRDEGNAP